MTSVCLERGEVKAHIRSSPSEAATPGQATELVEVSLSPAPQVVPDPLLYGKTGTLGMVPSPGHPVGRVGAEMETLVYAPQSEGAA